jgi:hypothetical protein
MSNKENVLEIIQAHPEGLDDDDISVLTGIRPRQQVQNLCNQLASNKQIRRESVNKGAKRRKIHNFPMGENSEGLEPNRLSGSTGWQRQLSALVAATGQSEEKVLTNALQLLALEVLRSSSSTTRQS